MQHSVGFYLILASCLRVGCCQEMKEYVVTVEKGGSDSAQTSSVKEQLLQAFGATVSKEVVIGKRKFLMTKTSPEASVKIKSLQGVLHVEPNIKIKACLLKTVPDNNAAEKFQSKFTAEAKIQNTDATMLQSDPVYTTGPADSTKAPDNDTTEAPESPVTTTVGEPAEVCYEQASGSLLWGLTRVVQRDSWTPADNSTSMDPKDGTYTYSSIDDGAGVDIYIVDTGILTTHTDFNGRAAHVFTATDLQYEGDGDRNGHGTHVAGSAGATTFGVAKRSTLMSVKVLNRDGEGSLFTILEGMQYVFDRFQLAVIGTGKRPKLVMNMSLGVAAVVPTLDDAVEQMAAAGVIIVVAAGNDAIDACTGSPARAPDAITVGSTNRLDELSDFSNYGPCVDILAPGSEIIATYIPNSDSVAMLSGTSMAAPFVAGIIARYLQSMDEPPMPAEVTEWLRSTSTGGVIDVDIGNSTSGVTTDNLLYKNCLPGKEYGPPTDSPSPTDGPGPTDGPTDAAMNYNSMNEIITVTMVAMAHVLFPMS